MNHVLQFLLILLIFSLAAGCSYSDNEIYYVEPVPGDSATVEVFSNLDTMVLSVVSDSLLFSFETSIEGGELYFAEASIERSHYPVGPARQIAAIQAAPAREGLLAKLALPTTVIHGTEDPFIPLIGGELTAKAIPGAELIGIQGMGHELFSPTLNLLEGMIAEHLAKAAGS